MPGEASITVIIPVKNGAEYLAGALDSVLAQTWLPEEILVVDGGSSDGSCEVAHRYPRTSVIPQDGAGLAAAWNTGIQRATGELLAFLDSDDRWTRIKLERQRAMLQAQPRLDAVVGEVLFEDVNGDAHRHFRSELFQAPRTGRIPGTLLARASLFRTIGGFDPAYTVAADVDWFARCKDAGVRVGVLPELVLHKRIHGGNLSLQIKRNNTELLRILRTSQARGRQRNVRPGAR